MPRMVLMLLAVVAWTAVIADGLMRLESGDTLVPAAMAVAGLGYVAIRLLVIRLRPVPEAQRSS